MVSKIDSPITPLEQTEKINEIIDNLGRGGVCLLDHKWSDRLLNDQNWLRADTFSWQDETGHSDAYNHLVDDLSTATQKEDGLVEWTQPVLTGSTTSTDLGNIVVTSSSNYTGYDNWKAMNGVKSGTNASSGWGTNNSNSGWWQVKFPYKLLITGLKGYQRYDSTPANANTVGRFYTSSSKETPIGDEYVNASGVNWSAVEVTGIPTGGIITDTIYFEKTSAAYGGFGELEITARRLTSEYPITYYEAQDGHKICLPDQEATVLNIYNESGVAWYYILDTANQRFKLPRELPITDKIKGNGMTLGITDGTQNSGLVSGTTNGVRRLADDKNAYGANVGYSGTWAHANETSFGITLDQTKSGIISHRANGNGKQYLYFYVGQYNQSATEQTAGLNSELFNGKMDRDMSNMNPSQTVKETIVGWGMPDYTTGISRSWDTSYQAEKDTVICYQTNHQSGNDNVAPKVSSDNSTWITLYEQNAGTISLKVAGWFFCPKGWYWKMVGGRNVDRMLKSYIVKGE